MEASPETQRSAPAVLEELLAQAQSAGASDVHIQMRGGTGEVHFRMDGLLAPFSRLEEDLAERVFGRIKYLARLKTYQESLPQDGRINHQDIGLKHDVRVATYPTVTGEKVVLRLFTEAALPLEELSLPAPAEERLHDFLRGQSGLLLLTGPAGSGKTTTIYACLQALAGEGGRHVITIEDPVEQVLPGIMQTETNEAQGLTFGAAARHLLRQDPQVLVIGEIRDEETANIAVRASLTGHLVISTLHAGSCRGVAERLFDLCDDRHSAVSSLSLILNQRLMRRLCAGCSGAGCASCVRTGYRGRVPAVEWVAVDDALRKSLADRDASGLNPQPALRESARNAVNAGTTDERELVRVFGGG